MATLLPMPIPTSMCSTLDTNLRYQQDLTRIRMAILLLVVPNNRLSAVLEHARRLSPLLGEELAGRFLEV